MKPIFQYDLDGNFIREWPSIKEAEQQLKITGISFNVNGIINYVGNYIFKYKKDNYFTIEINNLLRGKNKIIQYSTDNIFIQEYSSIKEAIEITKIKTIYKCLSGQNKTSGGYIFKYKNNGIISSLG